MVMLHIKLKLTTLAATCNGSKYFTHRHTLDSGVGVKRSNYIFSESSHVAYQIKADEAGSNMVANILPTDTEHPQPRGLGQKAKLYLFLKVVMLHITLKGIKHRAP